MNRFPDNGSPSVVVPPVDSACAVSSVIPESWPDRSLEAVGQAPCSSVWPDFLTGQKGSPVRVLLVDDDPHIRLVIAQELMADARTLLVAQAGSVREGRRAIKQREFDVLLVDLNLGTATRLTCRST